MNRINIIAGLSGTGKTTLAQEEMKSLTAQGKKITVFVPDQFSFETERRLYSVIGARNIALVKVTSFSRIAREILTQYRLVKPYADDVVKQITMLRAVKSLDGSLTYYRRGAAKTGFVKKLLKTVASFKNAGYTPKTLTAELNSDNAPSGALFEKMSDLALIFSAYDELLTRTLDDKLDDVSRAAETALAHGYFDGSVCFFDNFDTFSKVQQKLLEVIFAQCERSTLCLTTDAENSRDRRFFCINKTIDALKTLTDASLIGFTLCKEPYRERRAAENPIKCLECENPYEEARYIAAEIRGTVIKEGARYRDFLVLTADRACAAAVTDKLSQYEIPSFSDFPQPFTAKPAVSFVLTILKALSFETEDLLRYFESGFVRADNGKGGCTTLKSNRVDALKKAAAKYLLNRESWLNEFTDSDEIKLSALEPLRKELIGQLLTLKQMLENASDGAQMTAVFVDFLMNVQHLNATFIGNSKAGSGGFTEELVLDAQTAAEYQRIWETLTAVFDSMAYCLSDVKMSVSDFYDTLSSVLSELTLANPPKVLDCVTVGDLERSRKSSPKYVFICGMNEGAIPRKTALQSVLNAADVEKLHESRMEIGDARLTRWSKELYFTYRAVSAPEKRLIVTFSKRSFSGSEQEPSSYIENELKVKPASASQLPPEFFATTSASAKAVLAKYYGDEKLRNALELALDSDYTALLKNAAEFSQGELRNVKMPPELAEQLFDMTKYSPTTLETIFGCPFSFFCKYGLKVRNEDGQDIDDAREIGNAVHVAMQTAIGSYIDGKNGGFESFTALGKDDVSALAEQSLKTAEEQYLCRSRSDRNRVRAFIKALQPRIKMLLLQLQTDLKETQFVPVATEQRVSFALGEDVSVEGVADRIDKRKTEGGELIRICDYKTGSKKLDLDAAASGSGLQMFLYLFAQEQLGAVQYVSAKAGSASRSVRGGENDAQSWLDSHRVSGAYTGAELSASYQSLNKAYCDEAGAGDRTQFVKMAELSEESFNAFKSYCTKTLIGNAIKSVKSGEIPAVPLNFGSSKTACGYCDFKYLCGNKNGVFESREIKDGAFEDAVKPTEKKGV